MTGISVSGVTIESAEPEKLAAWWAEALAYRNLVLRDPEGNEFCVGGPGGADVPAEGS